MTKISYINKKIGTSHFIWLQNSNQYFYLEEPAWYVFRRIAKRHKSETIAKEFSNRYGLNGKDSLNFVLEIRQKINEINHPALQIEDTEKITSLHDKQACSPYSRFTYNMQSKIIDFSYETSWLESWIHPLIKHLESTGKPKERSNFELLTHENRVILRIDKVVKDSWEKDESSLVKGRVFIELLNVIHNKKDSDWLMTVHASAVTNGKKTVLFSAAAGSGKTTIAALLQTQGYSIISDDFVPVEKSTFKAYPLPIAMSVKEGSMNLLSAHYPELDINSFVKVSSKKKVKYLPVDANIVNLIFPVNEFIFIKYDNSVDLELEKADPVDALKRLFEEAWIPSSAENAAIFLDKILNVSFYNLTYSNNEKAIEAINQIFEND